MSTDISKSILDGVPEVHNSPSEAVIGDVHTLNKTRFLAAGIWPSSKELNFENAIPELANLGYTKFYSGKNADLYIIPDTTPLQILMYRTDKTSVFNIPLNLVVEGKGEIQNQISTLGAKIAEKAGISTAYRPLPHNIPLDIKGRCQALELCAILEIELFGRKQGMELIMRNFITGTLFGLYAEKTPLQKQVKELLLKISSVKYCHVQSEIEKGLQIVTVTGITEAPIKLELPRYAYENDIDGEYGDSKENTLQDLQMILARVRKNLADPYGLELPKGIEEWQDIRGKDGMPIFTPTDKTKDDVPINAQYVREQLMMSGYGEIVQKLQKLFAEFTAFALDRGYVVIDTKFEVFLDANGQWVIGDEILTPESSRFIKLEDFKAGKYISADKQFIRNLGIEFKWQERWTKILKEHKEKCLEEPKIFDILADITDVHRQTILKGYTDIQIALS